MKRKVVCIIQARLSSNRLPGKIKKLIGTQVLLEHLVNRAYLSDWIDKIVIAAPHSPECCLNEEIFIGSEKDVLNRYYECAKKYDAEIIVRLTADCPFVPPFEIDRVIQHLLENDLDYATNRPGMLDGFDVEVFTFEALKQANEEAIAEYDREHVTPYIKTSGKFKTSQLDSLKLSIDTPNDLKLARRWYEKERMVHGFFNEASTYYGGQS